MGTNYSWLTFSKEQEQSYAIDKRIMNGKISEKQALPFRQDLIDKIHKCIEKLDAAGRVYIKLPVN